MVTRNFQRCLDGRPFAQRVARRGGRPSRAFDDVRLLMFFGWEQRFARVMLCSLATKGLRSRGLERIFAGRCRCRSARDEEESDEELHYLLAVRGEGRQGVWRIGRRSAMGGGGRGMGDSSSGTYATR